MIRSFSALSPFLIAAILLVFTGCTRPPKDMVAVPAGNFKMGTDKVDKDQSALEVGFPHPWYEDEHPMRIINLPAFFIDRYEVTNQQYMEFVRAVQRRPPDNWTGGTIPQGAERFPVTDVSWFDADAYCRWKGKRLPTEEEWEKAARGPDGLEYPWGNGFDPSKARIATGSVMYNRPLPVGSFEAGKSPYGAFDMIGNVWEWVDGWYEAYPGNTAANDKFGRMLRVTRGLSFMSIGHFGGQDYMNTAAIIARASFRSFDFPTSRIGDVGFRCAMSPR